MARQHLLHLHLHIHWLGHRHRHGHSMDTNRDLGDTLLEDQEGIPPPGSQQPENTMRVVDEEHDNNNNTDKQSIVSDDNNNGNTLTSVSGKETVLHPSTTIELSTPIQEHIKQDSILSNEIKSTQNDNISLNSLSQIKTVYPIDAKLLQYCYLCRKTVAMIVIIKKLKESLFNNPQSLIIDPQSIILLSGPIFNINDNLYRRSEILQNCQKFNPSQSIDIPLILSPISFDSLENISRNFPVGPYGIQLNKVIPLPNKKKFLDTIILFELLLMSVYEITNSRFNIALNQANRQHNTNETKQSIIKKLENIQFTELNIINQLNFGNKIPEIPLNQQENILMYYLENQFKFLEIKLATYQNIIDNLKQEINKCLLSISKLKINNNKQVQQQQQQQLNSQFVPLYSMYTILLRISDLYIQIRKMGKTVYFQNVNYFSAYSKSRKGVKNALTALSIYFSHSKQNSMILTLISKYSRRTEIKNVNLDFDIFVSEFKKSSIETIALLNRMLIALREIHNEYTLIVKDGKINEFNKDVLREKMKIRFNNEREKRQQLLLERQKKLQLEMNHLHSSSITPSDVERDNTKNKLIARRVSSVNSLNSSGSINENNNNNNNSSNLNITKLRRTSITPNSINTSRNSSLTSSKNSPFYKSQSSGTVPSSTSVVRANSLTGTRKQNLSRRSSVGDFRNVSMGSINESAKTFTEPLKIGNTIQRKGSYGSLTSTTPTSTSSSSSRTSSLTHQSAYKGVRTSSLTNRTSTSTISNPQSLTKQSTVLNNKPPSINGSRSNSLTSSPSTKTKEMLQRRSSVINPTSNHRNESQTTTKATTPTNVAIRRRLSMNGLPVLTSGNNEIQIKAAALAAKRNSTQNLTAQQRLQQHILKSAQNGSVYGKPLETQRRTYKTSSPVKNNNDNNDNININNNNNETLKSLDEQLSSSINEDIELEITPNSITDLNGEIMTEFPGSPLNSLKSTSLEAQNALKLQMVNRSRSNSNTNVSNTPNSKIRNINSISPNKNSLSPSPSLSPSRTSMNTNSRNRSRSNSQLTKLTRERSIDSNGSISDISRKNSVSSSIGSRSRSRTSSIIIGNIDVVSESDIGKEINGEIEKKVRFAGVQQYSEDEDAPTPQQMQKQIKQKWAAYKPLFRKLNLQEGQAFKQNTHDKIEFQREQQGNNGLSPQKNLVSNGLVSSNNNSNNRISMMEMITSNAENEAVQNMSNMTLRRNHNNNNNNSSISSIVGDGGSATNRLSRLFRKR